MESSGQRPRRLRNTLKLSKDGPPTTKNHLAPNGSGAKVEGHRFKGFFHTRSEELFHSLPKCPLELQVGFQKNDRIHNKESIIQWF